ncbi:MAG: Rossmann-like and DUF2520 domain-containing protein [Bacteroidota bacterium]
MAVYASVFKEARPGVTVVGAGAVGRVLALRLRAHGYPIRAVLSRTRSGADALAREVEAARASDSLRDLPDTTRFLLVCVPDDELPRVADDLARVRHDWQGTVVAHVSGALPASVLDPLADLGADVLSFHPLQTITRQSDPAALDDIYVGLEGQAKAVAAGIELAVGLGMRYLVLSAEAKARYHLAASMASNFFVTLMGLVQETLLSLDIDRADSFAVIEPLVQGTLANLAASTPEDALTGPVVRGDLDTLRRHALALRQHLPHLIPVYSALTVETTRLAVRSGALDPEAAEDVLGLMQRLVNVPRPATPRRTGTDG